MQRIHKYGLAVLRDAKVLIVRERGSALFLMPGGKPEGAEDAPAAVAGQGAYRMADALRLRDITVERLGDDLLVSGYPDYPQAPE